MVREKFILFTGKCIKMLFSPNRTISYFEFVVHAFSTIHICNQKKIINICFVIFGQRKKYTYQYNRVCSLITGNKTKNDFICERRRTFGEGSNLKYKMEKGCGLKNKLLYLILHSSNFNSFFPCFYYRNYNPRQLVQYGKVSQSHT